MSKRFISPLREEPDPDETPDETSLHRDHMRYGCSNPDCWMCGNAAPRPEEEDE
jgi:hypothetical protein